MLVVGTHPACANCTVARSAGGWRWGVRSITVEVLSGKPVSEHEVEIVERKGQGHPDSICDAIMERVSIELSREYQRQFGTILHHNIDKGFVVAENAEIRLGGGRVTEPMRLIFGGRATAGMGGTQLPIDATAISSADRRMPSPPA